MTTMTMTMTMASASPAIQMIDQVRRAAFRAALSAPAIRFVLIDKDRRVGAHALICVVVAALVACVAPWVSLVLSPLLLGVPHLASEVRWLVVRQRPRARAGGRRQPARANERSAFLVAAIAIAIALVIAAVTGLARTEVGLGSSWVVLALCMNQSRSPRCRGRKRWIAAVVALVGIALAVFAPVQTLAIAVGLHGFVSIAIWALAFRKKRRFAVPAVVATLAGIALVAALRGPLVAQAFLQSVHYAVWIALVPQDGSRGAGTPTFAMSVRGWKKDLGLGGIAIAAIALAILVVAAITVGPETTRDAYLVTARFHVWLELAMAGALLARANNDKDDR